MTWRTAVKFIGTFPGKGKRALQVGTSLDMELEEQDTCPGLGHLPRAAPQSTKDRKLRISTMARA